VASVRNSPREKGGEWISSAFGSYSVHRNWEKKKGKESIARRNYEKTFQKKGGKKWAESFGNDHFSPAKGKSKPQYDVVKKRKLSQP